MDKQNKEHRTVTPEMVRQLIREHYSSDAEKMDALLKNIAAADKPAVDVDKIVADTIAGRKELLTKINEYEDELVMMMDLASVLHELRSTTCDESLDGYIDYLMEKNMEILPNIIEIIQFLKKY